jgi:hypothetical protein
MMATSGFGHINTTDTGEKILGVLRQMFPVPKSAAPPSKSGLKSSITAGCNEPQFSASTRVVERLKTAING